MSLTVPPSDLSSCTAIVCNGQIECSNDLAQRIQKCQMVIGVDGGINQYDKLGIVPKWIVGDFDSVSPELLKKIQADSNCTNLTRAKDNTDLEAAVDKAKALSVHAQVVIWGGLGGRLDHTLSNIYLLLRNPGQIFLESEKQVLFGASESSGEMKISHPQAKSVTFFPLSGSAKIMITDQNNVIKLPPLDKSHPYTHPFSETCSMKVNSGEVLVILDQNEPKTLGNLPANTITTKFTLEVPLANIFHHLAHQSMNFRVVELLSEDERVVNIQEESGEVTFHSQKGQTISLIPLYGPATGIKTTGLKWELGGELDRLDRDFVGISNVSMGDTFTVSVCGGQLLCIVNINIIDEEMVGL